MRANACDRSIHSHEAALDTSCAHAFAQLIHRIGGKHNISGRIALGDKPISRCDVTPPLTLHARNTAAVENVVTPLSTPPPIATSPSPHSTAVSKLAHRPLAVQWAAKKFHELLTQTGSTAAKKLKGHIGR